MSRMIPMRRSAMAVMAAALVVAAMAGVAAYAASGTTKTSFELVANPKFVNCLAKYPGDPSRPPTASVDVQKGNLNDRLTLHLRPLDPELLGRTIAWAPEEPVEIHERTFDAELFRLFACDPRAPA